MNAILLLLLSLLGKSALAEIVANISLGNAYISYDDADDFVNIGMSEEFDSCKGYQARLTEVNTASDCYFNSFDVSIDSTKDYPSLVFKNTGPALGEKGGNPNVTVSFDYAWKNVAPSDVCNDGSKFLNDTRFKMTIVGEGLKCADGTEDITFVFTFSNPDYGLELSAGDAFSLMFDCGATFPSGEFFEEKSAEEVDENLNPGNPDSTREFVGDGLVKVSLELSQRYSEGLTTPTARADCGYVDIDAKSEGDSISVSMTFKGVEGDSLTYDPDFIVEDGQLKEGVAMLPVVIGGIVLLILLCVVLPIVCCCCCCGKSKNAQIKP